ncbi:hypothetical protein [Flagellimonas zhangzhouensis]|uniref:Uncharacterized protein n=2 Tax=Flagellimonas zhangzhouensis TaxID=1073328 RepID=A0A1H2VY17_9FLAO|nr:hypothetical protein [Allomuricauda zhangzhouensis]SDQ04967.1 hypothetical protein SAMN05216294_0021 [Allomuricauda zhangzhouensis]SDW73121.1 hypothetical protein SAMN04487892_2271 [Allomuricauda zhangzhouensis]
MSCKFIEKDKIEFKKNQNEKLIAKNSNNNIHTEAGEYEWIHEFKTDLGDSLGDLYIKSINDSIFNSLRILSKKDTIYKIDNLDFWNVNGIDFDIPKNQENFYGYSIRLLGESHVVLSYYRNKGQNIADDLTLYYESNKKVFEIMMAP